MRLERGRERNAASIRRALRSLFRLVAFPKYDHSGVEESIIQWVAWQKLGILYLLAYPKYGMGEVEKVLLQVVAGTFEHIFAFSVSQNTNLARSRKR